MPSVQLDRDYQIVLLSLDDDDSQPSRLIKAYDTVFDFDTALALMDSGERVFPTHWPCNPLNGRVHFASRSSVYAERYWYLGGYYARGDLKDTCSNFKFMLMSPRDLDFIVVNDDKEVTEHGC